MKKLKKHFKKWNGWRKHSLNSKFHKLLVLFGIVKSPTFEYILQQKKSKKVLTKFSKQG